MLKIVLDDRCSREDFNGFCYERDWALEAIIDMDPDKGQPNQVISKDRKTGVLVAYTEDYLIDLRYVILDGEKSAVERLEAELYQATDIRVISKERVIETVTHATSPEELVLGLRWLAVIAPASFDQRYFDLFRIGLEHEHEGVRHAAIQVVSYPGWDVFKEVAQRMTEDPEMIVREAAKSLLRSYAKMEAAAAPQAVPEKSKGRPAPKRKRKRKS